MGASQPSNHPQQHLTAVLSRKLHSTAAALLTTAATAVSLQTAVFHICPSADSCVSQMSLMQTEAFHSCPSAEQQLKAVSLQTAAFQSCPYGYS